MSTSSTTGDATPSAAASTPPLQIRRSAVSSFLPVRGLRYHLLSWGDAGLVTPGRPPLVMLHGWMDVAASFQFVVDALPTDRYVVAPDWRGFGSTEGPPTDSYWAADYLGDLDALIDALTALAGLPAGAPIDLLGHSMGANVAMLYGGVRPSRVRRLVNLEGFGLPDADPQQAPAKLANWLDDLKQPARLRPYDSVHDVADRLRKTNPLLLPARAAWLARHWAKPLADVDGVTRWHLLADPAHKRRHPLLYRADEIEACWRRIAAPLLFVEGDRTDTSKWWGNRYPRHVFEKRLAAVPNVTQRVLSPAGHMLHHDQPEALAAALDAFFAA